MANGNGESDRWRWLLIAGMGASLTAGLGTAAGWWSSRDAREITESLRLEAVEALASVRAESTVARQSMEASLRRDIERLEREVATLESAVRSLEQLWYRRYLGPPGTGDPGYP